MRILIADDQKRTRQGLKALLSTSLPGTEIWEAANGAEALKLAYADRDTYYGDPKFNHIPADVLLSKEYAAQRRKLITDKASQEFLPGDILDVRREIARDGVNGERGHGPARGRPEQFHTPRQP